MTAERESSPGIGGRCKDCRHWTAFVSKRADPQDPIEKNSLGLCGKVVSRRQFDGEWDDEKRRPIPAKETLALVEDLSDACGLRTAAEFGCVLWEPRS